MIRAKTESLVAGLLAVCIIILVVRNITEEVPVVSDIESFPTIIVDPGHGGMDGGAVGVDNIVEKDINLAISMSLRDMLVVSGFNVVMTRDSDRSIHDEGVTGTRKQKTSDLHNRLSLTESYPDAIFISIHQNKFGGAKNRGAQMFYSKNNPQSQELAEILQVNFVTHLQPENARQIKKAGKDLYLMDNAKCPAVLVECGFLSNPEEAHLLTSAEYQNKVAFVTYMSVMAFLDTEPVRDAEFK